MHPLIGRVPAAGHITAGGYWHPGAERTCSKSPCAQRCEECGDRVRRSDAHRHVCENR